MTDDDAHLWRDRCDAYRHEVERTAKELTDLRDAVRALLASLPASAEMAAIRDLLPPETTT